jgi:hypothetical protein
MGVGGLCQYKYICTRTGHCKVRASERGAEVGNTSLATDGELGWLGIFDAFHVCGVVVGVEEGRGSVSGEAVALKPCCVFRTAFRVVQFDGVARATIREFFAKVFEFLNGRSLVGLVVVNVILHVVQICLDFHLDV